MKKGKLKSTIAVLLTAALIFSLAACSQGGGGSADSGAAAGGSAATTPATNAGGSSTTDVGDTNGDGEIIIGYYAITMVSAWLQNIAKALTELGDEQGFQVVSFDANFDSNEQMAQLDAMPAQGIDGAVVFIADEGTGSAVAEKCAQLGVPLIGETLRIFDADGKMLAPVVEINALEIGRMAGDWMEKEFENQGFDRTDLSTTGYLYLTNSNQLSAEIRVDGFEEVFFSRITDWPEANKFVSDTAAEATGSDDTDKTYKQVSAILGANPQITRWCIFSAVDDYGVGCCRAVEAANLQDKTVMVGIGGERGIPEWQAGNSPEWKATVYYNAMDFAIPLVEMMLDMINNGTPPTDLKPELKEPGEDYAAVKIIGQIVTPETYEDIYLPGY